MPRSDPDKTLTPPYLSLKTFLNFLERLSKIGMPNKIDRSINTMSSFSGAAQAQLITTLKYFHLITGADGTPTEKLHKLVKASNDEQKQMLREIIATSYPFLFKDGFDLKGATSKQLQDRFEAAGASGGTIRKSVAFFMAAAKYTGIELSPHIKKFRVTGSRPATTKAKKTPISEKQPSGGEDTGSHEETASWKQLFISKYPNFDPTWSDEVKAKWFDGMKDLKELMQKG